MDLPEPDSPTTPRRSRPSEKDTPRTASTRAGLGVEGHAQVLTSRSGAHRRALRVKDVAQAVAQQVEAEETMKIARPGMVATHHCSNRYLRPEEIIRPHSGSGGCAPKTQESQARGDQDDAGHVQRHTDDHRRQTHRA
jgi:hypothetical protein